MQPLFTIRELWLVVGCFLPSATEQSASTKDRLVSDPAIPKRSKQPFDVIFAPTSGLQSIPAVDIAQNQRPLRPIMSHSR
jgi:hypothetical protein